MLDAHLAMAKNLYHEGVITKNDLLQADVRLSDARQKILTAKNIRKITVSRLNTMLSRPLSSSLEAEEITGPMAGPTIDLEKAMEKAEKDRYEIRMVDVALDAVTLEATAKGQNITQDFLLKEGIITSAINMRFMTAPGLLWVE